MTRNKEEKEKKETLDESRRDWIFMLHSKPSRVTDDMCTVRSSYSMLMLRASTRRLVARLSKEEDSEGSRVEARIARGREPVVSRKVS